MKLARFLAKGRVHQGVYREGLLLDEAGEAHRPEDVTWLLPFTPGKILGVALNYADHAEELGLARPEEPALFWKPNTSLLPHKGVVLYPKGARFVHYEVELAVVVGRPMKKVKAKDALDYVLGYTIANDLVARDYVTNTFRPPIRAKGRDTFLPLGPFLVVEEVEDPQNLWLRAYVNGEPRQEGHTSRMLYSVAELLEFISEFMTLEPYDVLLTGTPKGISQVRPGDVMRLEIEGLGALENPIEEEP
ncbi:2-hydroxyhepta-2,4-diene-1,7-dioate isomerase [Thermus thermophilus]|uniref:fumarylacetoacetate hydrolase family protein n=1 Tax=Thermus thermophilus TaxID=274 RepID=UPI001FCA93FD|nr:fumarylacetoacetate hydrolase family protein [Thermus thermophilus]BDG18799.1 2-hydroxyhepta-2,4-diene-1,7-dioate isomerase [Thermus thermophilus]BDG26433.1 2-hydroxyhepta-2,4-diene-1,7-dioate isomerase [Thermus thermophilus]BDG28846.1 2-hydroxyhepta-2,4-diene-1,7-dioate isomerase [Thermus thermophilus]